MVFDLSFGPEFWLAEGEPYDWTDPEGEACPISVYQALWACRVHQPDLYRQIVTEAGAFDRENLEEDPGWTYVCPWCKDSAECPDCAEGQCDVHDHDCENWAGRCDQLRLVECDLAQCVQPESLLSYVRWLDTCGTLSVPVDVHVTAAGDTVLVYDEERRTLWRAEKKEAGILAKIGAGGTVICGTLRSVDLVLAFRAEMTRLDPDHEILQAEVPQPGDDLDEMCQDLIDSLDGLISDRLYFGSHWGDGADWGWWPIDPGA